MSKQYDWTVILTRVTNGWLHTRVGRQRPAHFRCSRENKINGRSELPSCKDEALPIECSLFSLVEIAAARCVLHSSNGCLTRAFIADRRRRAVGVGSSSARSAVPGSRAITEPPPRRTVCCNKHKHGTFFFGGGDRSRRYEYQQCLWHGECAQLPRPRRRGWISGSAPHLQNVQPREGVGGGRTVGRASSTPA